MPWAKNREFKINRYFTFFKMTHGYGIRMLIKSYYIESNFDAARSFKMLNKTDSIARFIDGPLVLLKTK